MRGSEVDCRMRNVDCGIKNAVFQTHLGWAGVTISKKGICRIALPRLSKRAVQRELDGTVLPLTPGLSREGRGGEKVLEKAVNLLGLYFSGERVSFDLSLDMRYYTAFQQAVWRATAEIPYGETRSYAWIAKRIGRPKAARAVGQAMGANPFPVIIP